MAGSFSVSILDRLGIPKNIPAGVKLVPQRFSAMARGGDDSADINATGDVLYLESMLGWLGHTIRIANPDDDVVWHGLVDEVTVTYGGYTAGLSLRQMVNKVKVIYTTLSADGADETRETDWAEDADSVAKYGTREAKVTLDRASDEQANAKRDSILQSLSAPITLITSDQSASVFASIHAMGRWHSLSNKYYEQDEGLEEYANGGADQTLGVGFTSTEIGFRADNKWIFNIGDGALLPDSKFKVSGSSSNNGTFTVRTLHEQDDLEYIANTIAFVAPDDITDSANGFGDLLDGDVIQVLDTGANDGIYELADADASAIEVDTAVTSEVAGSTFTFQRLDYVTVLEDVVDEDAGSSVTVTAFGVQIAQRFTQEVNASWTVGSIAVRMRRVGSPGDNVKVALHADSSGSPGTELDSGTIAGTDIANTMDWVEVPLSNTDTISFGTNYWIVVSRSGANSATDYYVVDVDEELGYTLGNLLLWDGSSWVARPTDADMPFRVLGALETTTQITNIVDEAEFLTGADIVDASGVESNQFREGDLDAKVEIESLLDSGTDNGKRLIAGVSVEGYLRIREKADVSDLTYGGNQLFWDANGQLRNKSGRARPLGELPVGRWVTLTEIPSATGYLASVSPFFCETAEYDVLTQRWFLEAEGTPDLWRLAELDIG